MKYAVAGFAALMMVIAAPLGSAQTAYPTRAVQIIVPFPPGGNTDILARVMADQYSTALKQPFTVVSRPGAGGNIGAAALVASEPDGHTCCWRRPGRMWSISISTQACHSIRKSLSRRSPWSHGSQTCWWCIRRSA